MGKEPGKEVPNRKALQKNDKYSIAEAHSTSKEAKGMGVDP